MSNGQLIDRSVAPVLTKKEPVRLFENNEGVPGRCMIEAPGSIPQFPWSPYRRIWGKDPWNMQADLKQKATISFLLNIVVYTDDHGHKWLNLGTRGAGFSVGHLGVDAGYERGCYQDYAKLVFTPQSDQILFAECAPTAANEHTNWSYEEAVSAELKLNKEEGTGTGTYAASRTVSGMTKDFEIISKMDVKQIGWEYYMRQTDRWENRPPKPYSDPADIFAAGQASLSGHVYLPATIAMSNIPVEIEALWKVAEPNAAGLEHVEFHLDVVQRLVHARKESGWRKEGLWWETSTLSSGHIFYLNLQTNDPSKIFTYGKKKTFNIENHSNDDRVKTNSKYDNRW